jgi:hypothetical protein
LRLRALGLAPLVLALTAIGPSQSAGAVGGSHLLADDKMPTPGVAWSGNATVTDDASVLGPCHLASLVDIGALSAVRRTWTVAGLPRGLAPRGIQVVARFADGRSARRAHQVLLAWQDDCAADDDLDVAPLRTVSVDAGVGNAYRVGHGTRATDLGILRKGSWISIVVLVAPSGQVPADSALARTAIKRVAATF